MSGLLNFPQPHPQSVSSKIQRFKVKGSPKRLQSFLKSRFVKAEIGEIQTGVATSAPFCFRRSSDPSSILPQTHSTL